MFVKFKRSSKGLATAEAKVRITMFRLNKPEEKKG
jgi:hypothetical protein